MVKLVCKNEDCNNVWNANASHYSKCPNCNLTNKIGVDETMPKVPTKEITKTDKYDCNDCGTEVTKDQKFCGGCGLEFDWSFLNESAN